MHITVLRDDLLHAVGPIQAVVDPRRSLPIPSHLLIATSPPCDLRSPSGLSISGTDLDIGVRKRVPGQILEEGSIALPAKKLHEMIRELPAASVDVAVDAALTATIACGHSEFRVKGLPKDDFPSMHEPHESALVLDRRLFCNMIRGTLFAVSSNQTRQTLNGLLFRVTPTHITMVATDGHRLAITTHELPPTPHHPPAAIEAILPRKAAAETLKLLRDEPGEIDIHLLDNHLLLHTDDTIIETRLIEGRFPNYEQIIPTTATKQVTVNRQALLAGLRRTSTVLEERTVLTTLTLTPGMLLLSCANPDLGHARERLEVEYQHEDMRVGFNARYILDFLNVLTADDVTIQLQDPLSPALFAPKNDTRHTCVIMPLRIS